MACRIWKWHENGMKMTPIFTIIFISKMLIWQYITSLEHISSLLLYNMQLTKISLISFQIVSFLVSKEYFSYKISSNRRLFVSVKVVGEKAPLLLFPLETMMNNNLYWFSAKHYIKRRRSVYTVQTNTLMLYKIDWGQSAMYQHNN